MAINIATVLSPATLDDNAWDDLLSFIEERRVIPIVGPELLQIRTDKGPRLLHDWAAEKLAARLNVDSRELPQPYTLNDVVCWFLAARGRREEAYVRLRARHSLALLRPAAKAASAPASVSLAYADALIRQGWEQNATAPAQAIKSFEEAKQVTVALGALTLANVFAATDHADADGFSSAALTSLGRLDEGTSAARSGAELARRVLVQRPGNRQALHAQEMSLSYLMAIPVSRLDPETAVQLGPQVLEASRVQLGLDPDNTVAISNQGVAYEDLAVADWRAGQLREGALVYRKSADVFGDLLTHANTSGVGNQAEALVWTGEVLAQLGDLPGLQALAADDARFLALHPLSSAAADDLHYRQSMAPYLQALTAEARGDQATARRLATEAAARVPWAERKVLAQTSIGSPGVLDALAARTALRMGDFAAAVKALDMALANWNLTENDAPDDVDFQRYSALHAIALGRAGRTAEAVTAGKAVLAAERRLASLNRTDRLQPYELALALYADALAEPANATANLAEATKVMDSLQPQVAALMGPKELRGWIRQAQARH